MGNYEKLGSFYLGRKYNLEERRAEGEELLYASKDLTTHAVCVGMTGSGKTGLCLTLLEEAAIDHIPAIVIDPKGDLGNLLLTFPDLAPEDFAPWVDPAEATRKGMTVEELAKKNAQDWRKGLADWDQTPDRIAKFRDSADIAIYTPGSNAGLPLTVVRSFSIPDDAILEDSDALRERITGAVSGLLALLGVQGDPLRSREHILLSTILERAWKGGRSLDLPQLIREIQKPSFTTIGVMDLESIFPAADRFALSMSLNNLLASPGFSAWLEGEPLDIARLLHTESGKPRISILSIAHLNDAERMFFVTILLNEVISWMRSQAGTSSLRAILSMDEVFGYFPPTANPPSKTPMLTLLKQARAFGLGVVLATQNPVDLDYKGLSNAGTWFIGRLQTDRDKQRVLEGLESASAGRGADRAQLGELLNALGKRIFLLNSVHLPAPVLFTTRWTMSYLRGPL
ncbi:MAG: ATP-binding protein, partial [Planctomycetaceae bacterium]